MSIRHKYTVKVIALIKKRIFRSQRKNSMQEIEALNFFFLFFFLIWCGIALKRMNGKETMTAKSGNISVCEKDEVNPLLLRCLYKERRTQSIPYIIPEIRCFLVREMHPVTTKQVSAGKEKLSRRTAE